MSKNNFRLIAYLTFAFVCIAIPWVLFCVFLQYFSFEIWDEKSEYIENIGYLGSFFGGTIGVFLTAGSLIFLAKTLNFERKKSDQDNFDNKFFLMLETLEGIKEKIDDELKNKILNKIDNISEFSIRKTLEESKKIVHKNNSNIGHYYRMLYQILKMIDQNESKISGFRNVQITYYTNILRATLDFKLTQILAINTYYSDDFDSEYKEYSEYTKKYNFYEHMPFFISEGLISESLLAVYLNCSRGFGNSSFVGKINGYVVKSIRTSILCNYDYDLKHSFLKRLVGNWSSNTERKILFCVDIRKMKIEIKLGREIIIINIINMIPETDKYIKYDCYYSASYKVSSHFDDSLNLIIIYEDNVDFLSQGGCINYDAKHIRFELSSNGLKNLKVKIDSNYIFEDYQENFEENMVRI